MGMKEVVIGDTRLAIYERGDTQDLVTGRAITGSWLWESAVYLSEWISEALVADRVRISGATVLELGAGTGLPGLFTANKGASWVILTDVGSLVPSLCANVEANWLEDLVQVMELNWGEDASMLGPVAVVLLSDLFYDPEEALPLARTLRSVWAEGTRGYAASEVRDGLEECLKILRQEEFKFENVVLTTRPLIRYSSETAVFAVYVVSRINCTTVNTGN